MPLVKMFGSCRIENPLMILQENKFLQGIKRDKNNTIHNSSQLLQKINNKKYHDLIRNNDKFFWKALEYLTDSNTGCHNLKNKVEEDFYIIEICSLKKFKFKDITLGVNIISDLKYLFGVNENYIQEHREPRKFRLNIRNILFLSRNKVDNYYTLYPQGVDKIFIRQNLEKEYTNDILFFKNKVCPNFFKYLCNMVYIFENIKYEIQSQEALFRELDEIKNIINKPIIFIPHINSKTIKGNIINSRDKINKYLQKYVISKPNMFFLNHHDLLENNKFEDIFEKYKKESKFEIENYGEYDMNHLSKKGSILFAEIIEKFIYKYLLQL
jgi:hypothetical protein